MSQFEPSAYYAAAFSAFISNCVLLQVAHFVMRAMQQKPEALVHTMTDSCQSTVDCEPDSAWISVTADCPAHFSVLIRECNHAGGDSAYLSLVPAVSLVAQICCITAGSPALLHCSAVPQRQL